MANFSTSNGQAGTAQAITGTFKTLVSVTAATALLKRLKVYDVMFGTIGTPADQTYEFDISRCSGTIGTGTTATPSPLDLADTAAGTVSTVNFTAETATVTPSVFYLGINQRASYRWVAAPGSELVGPATNLAGFVLRTKSVSGGTATATGEVLFQEQ